MKTEVAITEKRLESFKKSVETLQRRLDPNRKPKVLKSGIVGKVFLNGEAIEVYAKFGIPGEQISVYEGEVEHVFPATKLAKWLKGE